MTQKKSGDKAVAETLSKLELEIVQLRDSLGGKATEVGLLDKLDAADGINQSCNGICGGYEQITNISEVELERVVNAAARYNIDQLKAFTTLDNGHSDHPVNQGCNGIC